jgi:alpha-tubulin suppressor-like RCC1 family protein
LAEVDEEEKPLMKKRHSYVVLSALAAAALGSCSSLTTEVKQNSSSEPSNIRSVDLPYTSVEASYNGWYAVRKDGTVTRGQFFQNANIPVGLSNVKSVSSGGYRTVALKNDGTVVAWGTPAAGIDTTDAAFVPAGLNNVTQVSAGFGHTLALKEIVNTNGTVTRTVIGWGDPIYGLVPPEAQSDVVAISAGGSHSLALKSDGTVVAWGENPNRLIDGIVTDSNGYDVGSFLSIIRQEDPNEPAIGQTVATGLSNIKAISAGGAFSVALKNSGELVSWGTLASNSAPALVYNTAPAGSDFTAIATGGLHALALKADGTVVAWGDNLHGGLNVPTGLNNVIAISADTFCSVALRSDGRIVTWGGASNSVTCKGPEPKYYMPISGGIGFIRAIKDGTVWGSAAATPSTFTQIPNLIKTTTSSVTAISSAPQGTFTLALKSDKKLWGWGSNSFGQLGGIPAATSQTPSEIPGLNTPIGNLGTVLTMSGGNSHTLIVKGSTAGNSLHVIGNGGFGQLGIDPNTVGNGLFQPTAVTIPGVTSVTDVSAGSFHSLVLDSTGKVWSFGQNTYGQLGISNTNFTYVPTAAKETATQAITNVFNISGGDEHSLLVKNDGSVWSTGRNRYGELGLAAPAPSNTARATRFTVVPGISDAVNVVAGKGFSLVRTRDGRVFGAGLNTRGQLGLGSTGNHSTFQLNTNLSNVVSIAAGADFGLALKSDGTLWFFGSKGNGAQNFESAPIPILSGVTLPPLY